jgi:hypothetical protein
MLHLWLEWGLGGAFGYPNCDQNPTGTAIRGEWAPKVQQFSVLVVPTGMPRVAPRFFVPPFFPILSYILAHSVFHVV